ncbi:MAG TPA: GNAT family N-acetyltransferase [Corynebacteriales bacterium]|nr:GNAT family N-acetyltransferase [Mycobacteriales bacterium]
MSDWQRVHMYASDPEVVKFMEWGPNTAEESKDFVRMAIAIQKDKPRRHFDLAIVTGPEDCLIGGCGLYVTSSHNREAFIGYCLSRDSWGKGYATEAAKRLICFGFTQLRLHRIFATCDPLNVASAKVLEKCGMTPEGRLRENKLIGKKWRDSLLYAILEHEWNSK